MEQAKFTKSPIGKALEKYTKTIEDHREKLIQALHYLGFPNKINKLRQINDFCLGNQLTNLINNIHDFNEQ